MWLLQLLYGIFLLLLRWCCWCADAAAALRLLKCWWCWCTVAANLLLLRMRWCADAADALMLLMHRSFWCADPADALFLLMHWSCWCTDADDALMCWCCWCADALMLLNQDQDLLADLSIAICSSFLDATYIFCSFLFKATCIIVTANDSQLNSRHNLPSIAMTTSY